MNRSYRSNIVDNHPLPIGDDEKLLVFECDFSSYHVAFIRAGIGRYFASGSHALSYIQLSVLGSVELFGPSVLERMAVIGLVHERKTIDFLLENGVPFLSLEESAESGLGAEISFKGEGTMAAEYFIEEANCEHLGFIGDHHAAVGHRRRLQELSRVAESRGVSVEPLHLLSDHPPLPIGPPLLEKAVRRKDALRSFLSRIRKPAGILCGNDMIAMRVYYTAEVMGIRVPEELVILGVGSRERFKDPWAHVPSVVQLDHELLGYTAAKLMDQHISTGEVPGPVVLSPSGICHGQTTFRRMVGDSLVMDALKMIQKDPSLDVLAVCEQSGLSRKALDIRFQRATNMTLAKAIEMERFNQAKHLIRQKQFSLDAIASMAGYPSRKGMRRSFYRFARMSPREFRNLSDAG